MRHRWLSLISIGFIGLIVFIFFWYRNQPIEIPSLEQETQIVSLTEPTITFVNPTKGAEDPTITIVEFGDFECGPCVSLATSLNVVAKTFPEDVRIVWKDLPNESIHALATPAAIAAHCADQQGAFWSYHDELFLRQTYLTEGHFSEIADKIGLNIDKFESCFNTRDTLPIVKKDYTEGLALGLTSTPTIFIGEQSYVGAISTDDLLDIVAKLISSK